MAVSESYLEFVMERLEQLGTVTARKMFGGVGLYFDGTFFALIDDDVLYFKVDAENEGDYREAGMEAFKPFGADSYAMKYYALPEHVLEDDGELHHWARGAIEAATRKGRKRGAGGRKSRSTGRQSKQPASKPTRKKDGDEKSRQKTDRKRSKPGKNGGNQNHS